MTTEGQRKAFASGADRDVNVCLSVRDGYAFCLPVVFVFCLLSDKLCECDARVCACVCVCMKTIAQEQDRLCH